VAAPIRGECVSALNRFRNEHGLLPIAVTCRRQEYEALTGRLELYAAVQLRELSDQQIDGYLQAASPRFGWLSEALGADPDLRELARSPLMLNVMCLAYSPGNERSARPAEEPEHTPEQRRCELLGRYVERMLRRPNARTGVSRRQTLRSLIWLARDL